MSALREHEAELLQALADGLTLRGYADGRGVTYQRAKDVAADVRRLMGAATNEQAVAQAVALGVVQVAGIEDRMSKALALVERAARVLGAS